jgi:hypothetical protein
MLDAGFKEKQRVMIGMKDIGFWILDAGFKEKQRVMIGM